MNRATPQMRAFAALIIGRETSSKTSPRETNLPAAFPVSDRLRSHLKTVIGASGVRALVSRSLAMASAELPWLGAVRVGTDGALEGFDEIHPQPTPAMLSEGREVLLAQWLELLVTLIGPALTRRMVSETWPSIFLSDLNLGHGDHDEKTK